MFERLLGCTVAEAPDGPEALALMRARTPDLVVLDVHLPTMSGVEVLRTMREDTRLTHVPCVAITSESHRPVIEELVAGQVRDILLKPVVIARDVPRLQRVLNSLTAAARREAAAS